MFCSKLPNRAALSVVAVFIVAVSAANDSNTLYTTIYDADEQHLWNRVHAALMVRTGPDGRSYGLDRLEPLLWADSTYLIDGQSADRAVTVLEEFVRGDGAKFIDEPVKRAILQRDLWLTGTIVPAD